MSGPVPDPELHGAAALAASQTAPDPVPDRSGATTPAGRVDAPTPRPAGVPTHLEIATLMGAVLEGDLTQEQRDLLADLLGEVGSTVRVRARLAERHRHSLWDQVAGTFIALVEVSR